DPVQENGREGLGAAIDPSRDHQRGGLAGHPLPIALVTGNAVAIVFFPLAHPLVDPGDLDIRLTATPKRRTGSWLVIRTDVDAVPESVDGSEELAATEDQDQSTHDNDGKAHAPASGGQERIFAADRLVDVLGIDRSQLVVEVLI